MDSLSFLPIYKKVVALTTLTGGLSEIMKLMKKLSYWFVLFTSELFTLELFGLSFSRRYSEKMPILW